jgi:ABC-type protease/lipase transport system fused ATPase/permease subunit
MLTAHIDLLEELVSFRLGGELKQVAHKEWKFFDLDLPCLININDIKSFSDHLFVIVDLFLNGVFFLLLFLLLFFLLICAFHAHIVVTFFAVHKGLATTAAAFVANGTSTVSSSKLIQLNLVDLRLSVTPCTNIFYF